MSLRERMAHTPPGYRFSIGRILAIYSGLMVALLLAALDQTIVATALPTVVSELGGITQYSWVFTAYLLASTVTVPLYGKLGDLYGRRPLFLVSISIFLVGSALCGLAQGMTELVLFRAVQGIGAGGLFPLAIATVGVIVPPRDRGRYQGLIGAVFAAASIIGPAVGGFIVDNASWRWIFYINLPIGGLALLVISLTMPRRRDRREHSIDWVGFALLAGGTTALLLGLTWAGRDYAWTSGHVLLALVTSAGFLTAFAFVERRVPETILPFDTLRNPIVSSSVLSMALIGMANLGDVVRRRSHAVDARRGCDVDPLGAAGLAHRSVPLERHDRSGCADARDAAAVADGRAHDERRSGPRHDRRRDRNRIDDAGVRPLRSERCSPREHGLSHRADAVLALDRRDDRRDGDGRDRQPRPAGPGAGRGRADAPVAAGASWSPRRRTAPRLPGGGHRERARLGDRRARGQGGPIAARLRGRGHQGGRSRVLGGPRPSAAPLSGVAFQA